MSSNDIVRLTENMEIPDDIPVGDMPGDRINIGDELILKAKRIFPALYEKVKDSLNNNPHGRAIVTICGGSGVGKSCIASVLSYIFNETGIGSYIISGDNYPHRIPVDNDRERLRIFRKGGIHALTGNDTLTPEISQTILQLQKDDLDSDPGLSRKYPWLTDYIEGGTELLRRYLGSPDELDFDELNMILRSFLDGADTLWLKRMGRDLSSLWYEKCDMRNKQLIVVEWTHGNSDHITVPAIPVLLNSTPEETLKYRQQRGRDGHTDSPFTMLTLALEQQMLTAQAHKAAFIMLKTGELVDYQEFLKLTS